MIEHEQCMNLTDNKMLDHEEFLNRIKKTLYYGSSTVKCTKISRPLADYAADTFSESHRGHSLSRLNFVTVGNLTVTPCSLILAMIYLDRLNTIDPAYARRITPSELFIVSMMVSTKFYCGYDEDIYLSAWAESGNMTVDHMKELELEFLDAIGWKVYVSNQEFFEKLKSVEKILAKRQGLSRGWLTYTELINFLPTMTLAKQILNYSTVIALSYTASVMTIAGAFFLASSINVPGNLLFRRGSNGMSGTTNGTTTFEVADPSLQAQNCSLPDAPTGTLEQSLPLEDCECSLQLSIDSAQLLNRAFFNDNSNFEHHHHYKADYKQFPTVRFASTVDSYGSIIDWKFLRFIYPSSDGNMKEDDENATETHIYNLSLTEERTENRNCTDEFDPMLTSEERLQPELAKIVKQPPGHGYTKRTFEMFSSILKFL
ncbi:protein CNPPD1 [Toxorhynchites rutilus septentrionalis]|uniref:protein CNPPD1 n=1 Tax=Toxorhynchites rutilus septentrionalis TaxID=329112 RepID=UPI00247B202C|nr:protein CNPPD1 [Toxorhynchites rutilus septentrionalis]